MIQTLSHEVERLKEQLLHNQHKPSVAFAALPHHPPPPAVQPPAFAPAPVVAGVPVLQQSVQPQQQQAPAQTGAQVPVQPSLSYPLPVAAQTLDPSQQAAYSGYPANSVPMQQPVYDAYTTQPTVYDQQPYMQATYPHAGVYWDEYEEPYYDDEFDSYVRPRRERSSSRSRRHRSHSRDRRSTSRGASRGRSPHDSDDYVTRRHHRNQRSVSPRHRSGKRDASYDDEERRRARSHSRGNTRSASHSPDARYAEMRRYFVPRRTSPVQPRARSALGSPVHHLPPAYPARSAWPSSVPYYHQAHYSPYQTTPQAALAMAAQPATNSQQAAYAPAAASSYNPYVTSAQVPAAGSVQGSQLALGSGQTQLAAQSQMSLSSSNPQLQQQLQQQQQTAQG